MKGVVLAGGTGSRLLPLTKVTNKHLLPVARMPMIFHPILKLVEAGIKDILIVTGVNFMGSLVNLLGSGKEFGCEFTYKVQEDAGGIAQALGLAKEFAGGGKVVAILGDNIFEDKLQPFIAAFEKQKKGGMILLKEVSDPERFGVVGFEGEKVVSIEEKPKKPKSNFAITGIYFYDSQVYEIIKTLKPSARGELEISGVNNVYLRKGQLNYKVLSGWWSDAGTFQSLERATLLVEGRLKL